MADGPATTRLFSDLQAAAHIWFCNPLQIHDREKLAAYLSVLSEQEFDRYHRFYFDKDKHSYLVSHALLRYALSKYVDIDASQWQFSSNAHGKPELLSQPLKQAINFNLTHTDGLCACIITLDKSCGIDAENISRKNRFEAVAKRMFAEEEQQCLKMNNIEQQFYYYWTLREAYVKARGTGLAGSSKAFYFDTDMKRMTASIHHRNVQQPDDKNWYFRMYEPTQEHVLSVAIASHQAVRLQISELVP
jgi:4'-phosphopantetheinyl transferase